METSPSKYYLELRITQARRLLLQTSHSITDIALACGFVSSSHFSNCYKDYFGTAPTFAREQHRQ
nr:helix-turn-helix domain-containing protein [Aliamphritea spongicola]